MKHIERHVFVIEFQIFSSTWPLDVTASLDVRGVNYKMATCLSANGQWSLFNRHPVYSIKVYFRRKIVHGGYIFEHISLSNISLKIFADLYDEYMNRKNLDNLI